MLHLVSRTPAGGLQSRKLQSGDLHSGGLLPGCLQYIEPPTKPRFQSFQICAICLRVFNVVKPKSACESKSESMFIDFTLLYSCFVKLNVKAFLLFFDSLGTDQNS